MGAQVVNEATVEVEGHQAASSALLSFALVLTYHLADWFCRHFVDVDYSGNAQSTSLYKDVLPSMPLSSNSPAKSVGVSS